MAIWTKNRTPQQMCAVIKVKSSPTKYQKGSFLFRGDFLEGQGECFNLIVKIVWWSEEFCCSKISKNRINLWGCKYIFTSLFVVLTRAAIPLNCPQGRQSFTRFTQMFLNFLGIIKDRSQKLARSQKNWTTDICKLWNHRCSYINMRNWDIHKICQTLWVLHFQKTRKKLSV